MREATHYKGPFARKNGWDYTKVAYLIENFLTCLRKHIDEERFRQFACTVDVKAWRAYKAAGFPVCDNPIELCNQYCPFNVLGWYFKDHPGLMKQLHYFFDENEPFREPFEQDWKKAKSDSLSAHGTDYVWAMITTVMPTDMRDKPALQAADLLAWSTNRSITVAEGRRFKFKRLGTAIKQIVPSSWIFWDEAEFARKFGPLAKRPLGQ